MPSEDWLRGERKSWEGPGGQVPRISLQAPACLGECSSFTNSWVDSGMVLGVLRSDQHYWLSRLLWLSDGASEQTQRSRVRAYRGTLALGVQWHLFCCLCGGSASCLRSEEGRQLSLPSGPRDPLSREHFTNLCGWQLLVLGTCPLWKELVNRESVLRETGPEESLLYPIL